MSTNSFANIQKCHPDLQETTEIISEWMDSQSDHSVLNTREVIRELSDKLTPFEIVAFFSALRESKLASVSYQVVDPDGRLAPGEYDRLEDLPDEEEDRFGRLFPVTRESVVQVYRLK